jgi:hypothetical protein
MTFLGICVALGFFIVWLDMIASAKMFSSMRNNINALQARIAKLERDVEKSG